MSKQTTFDNTVIPFLDYEMDLWGRTGRHLCNFAVLGFAYFLAKNRARFFDKKGKLVIKTTRRDVSQKRRGRNEEYESKSDSDYAKLSSLEKRWETLKDQLHIQAPRDPVRIAYEINLAFWKNRALSQRLWRPELSL